MEERYYNCNLDVESTETENIEVAEPEGYFMGLSANNTVADVVTELYDAVFREILGDDVMDSTLGGLSRKELFRVMSKIFLQDGNRTIFKQLANS